MLASQTHFNGDDTDLLDLKDAMVNTPSAEAFRGSPFIRALLVEHGATSLDGIIRKGGLTLMQKSGHDVAVRKGWSQQAIISCLQNGPEQNHLLSIDPSLSEQGTSQAQRAAAVIGYLNERHLLREECYTSEQNRTLETGAELGFATGNNALPHLNERIMIPQAGLTKTLIGERYPNLFQQIQSGEMLQHEGIEPIEFFKARIARGISTILHEQSSPEDNERWQVIITHQTVIKILLASSLPEGVIPDPFALDIPNCSLTPLLLSYRSFRENEGQWFSAFNRQHAQSVSRPNFFDPKVLLPDEWNTLRTMPVSVPVYPSLTYLKHCDAH